MQRLRNFLFLVSFILAAPFAQAQTSDQWPQRPVRFIIPLGPGSGVDITARLLADNPTLMRLRELEVLEKVAANSKLNIVLGEKGLTDRVVNVL